MKSVATSAGLEVRIYEQGTSARGVRFVQGLVGESDLISLSIDASGKETFCMRPGQLSRREGQIYHAFKELLSA